MPTKFKMGNDKPPPMTERKVVIVIGSREDTGFVRPIAKFLEKFRIDFDLRIASAHKTPKKLLEIIDEYDSSGMKVVYITVAGRSNALSGMVDANTRHPVIACPPISGEFGGADIYSSLRMPSGVAPLVVLDPENAALAAAKILALGDGKLSERIRKYQEKMREKIERDDRRIRR